LSATNESSAPSEVAPVAEVRKSKTRERLWLLAKLSVAGLAFTYVFTRQSWSELTEALGRLTPVTLTLALLLTFMCLSTATLRWYCLLRAYGAVHLPSVLSLMRVYYVGNFYNIYLPGAVGGDVVRGVAMRNAFAEGGATTSVAVVFVERAIGLLGVLIAVALAVPLEDKGHMGHDFLPYLGIGVFAVFALIVGIAQAPRIAHYVPRSIGNIMRGLPVLERYAPFALAVLISVAIQMMLISCGHVVVSSIYPEARFVDSMLVVPLAAGAAFFPLSVAGAGPRDAVLVTLYAMAGVPRPAAAATALVLLFATLIVGATGGVMQLLAPLTLQKRGA
jgi:uncharacterized membrane protein YbhN (UPF0104 family)